MVLGEEEWRCPTCLDLLYKPAVNTTCGHIYCFWCLHKAMSPYTPSSCPVCRAKYTHLPAICPKLHRFLSCQLPERYAARRQETEAEERQSGGASPDPEEAGPLPPPASPGAWRPLHFACDSPACRKLLCRPVVLTCGHSVCQLTCLPSCCCCGGGEGATAWECPACGMATRQPPAVCKQLGDLLVQLFPEESARREAECQQAAQERVAAEGGGGGSGSVQPPSQSQQAAQQAATRRRALARRVAQAAAAETLAPGGQPQQQALSPALATALRRRQAAGGRSQELAERLEANLQQLTGDAYTHHGVGCDGCGLYPIQGRRYQCRDCPDAMGFDLCGACMDRGLSDIVGRFNQKHTPEHRMRLAANPELPMDQLMWLLELTLTGGDEEEQRAPPPPQQQQGDRHAPPQQQQQGPPAPAGGGGSSGSGGSGAAVDGAAEELEFPALRRGPRPAYDAAAQEPSPSAHARPQPAPGQGAAAAASQGPGERGLIGGSDSGEEQEVHVPLESVLGGEQGAPSR